MSFSSSTRPPAAGARAAKTAAAPNRLPGGRERRPALAALAVILILLGAAGSALIAVNNGSRQYYVAVREALPPGHRIEPGDLTRGDLAGDTGTLVLWSEAGDLENKYTTSWLYPGQFVTKRNYTADAVPRGGALIGVTLEGGRAPAETIEIGDVVRVIRIPGSNAEGGAAQVIAPAAEVTGTSGALTDEDTNANGTLNVTILVPETKSTVVAAAAAAKTLVLVKLADSVEPEISRGGDR